MDWSDGPVPLAHIRSENDLAQELAEDEGFDDFDGYNEEIHVFSCVTYFLGIPQWRRIWTGVGTFPGENGDTVSEWPDAEVKLQLLESEKW